MAENEESVMNVFVKEERIERVKHYIDHVQKLFAVSLAFTSATGKQFMVDPGQWLDVKGKREDVVKAKVRIWNLILF